VAELRKRLGLSERRACRAVGQSRSSQRYLTKPRCDEPRLLRRLLQLVRRRPRFGYRRIAALLRGEGYAASESRVLRLWRREGLRVPPKKRKKGRWGVAENGCDWLAATHKNHVWAWDFAFDQTENGTQLECLLIVDEHTRERLALEVARSITSEDLIDTVAELLAMRGVPENFRSDNGPEFVAKELRAWLAQVGVRTCYVEPASPGQNGPRLLGIG
jgi:putative transposase